IDRGVRLDAALSVELLTSIFVPYAPMHDGAAIIRDGRVAAAKVIFSTLGMQPRDVELGTRHRAAVGLTEERDALCVVVSEETGTISVAHDGRLIRGLDEA